MNTRFVAACIFAVIFSVIQLSNAEPQDDSDWIQRYNGSGGLLDYSKAIAVDNSDNVIVVGKSWSQAGNFDFITLKYSPEGVLLWDETLDAGSDADDSAMSVAVTLQGDIYVGGIAPSIAGNQDYFLIKYTADGDTVWTRRYDAGSNDRLAEIAADIYGNVVMTGSSQGSNGYDYTTVKFSPAGNQMWVARYNGYSSLNDYSYAIHTDREANVYITGTSWKRSNFNNIHSIATVKYSDVGTQQWAVHRWSHEPCEGLDVTADNSGNVYVTGHEWSFSGYEKSNYVTIKYSSTGSASWTRLYNGSASNYDYARKIAIDPNGNVFVTGESYGSGTGYDIVTVAYNAAGTQIGIDRFDGPVSDNDYARDIVSVGPDSLLVAGTSVGDGSSDDIVLLLYDSECTLYSDWPRRYNGEANLADRGVAAKAGNSGVYVAGISDGGASFFDFVTMKYGLSQSGFCTDFEGLFCDDFEDGASPLWQTLIDDGCTWIESDGIFSTSNTSGTQEWCIQTVGDQSWADVAIEAKVRGNSGVDKILVFRIQDADNFYAVNLRSDYPSPGTDQLTFDKMVNGVYTTDIATADYPSENGVWYRLKVVPKCNNFRVYVDDALVLEYTDNDNPYYTGGIGVACWTGPEGNCDVSFDDVSVSYFFDEPYYFVHITDTHYGKRGARQNVRSLLNEIVSSENKPAFVIVTGDILEFGSSSGTTNESPFYELEYNDYFVFFLDLFQILEQNGVPYYVCPGNHDYAMSPYMMDDLEQYNLFFDEDFVIRTRNLCLISVNSGMDDYDFNPFKPPRSTGPETSQLDWIEETLDDLDGDPSNNSDESGLAKVIMLHHPVINFERFALCTDEFTFPLPYPCFFQWDTGVISDDSKEAFKQHCATYGVDAVCAGHTHHSRVYQASMDGGSNICDQGGYDRAFKTFLCPDVSFPLSSSLEGTLYEYTGAAKKGCYRKIHVNSDGVVVDKQSLSRNLIVLEGSGGGSWKNRDDSDICPMTLHLFDSLGNHVGRNDISGLDFQIDGAVYSILPLTPISDPDSILLVNTIEEISTFTDSGDFRYEIHGTDDGAVFIQLRRGLTDGTEITAFYDSVTVTEGCIGKLYVNSDSVNYTIYMDDDGDGTTDREIEPDMLYPQDYICGDADASGAVDIDDVVYLLNYIFVDGPAPVPLESGDANCSGDIDIDDVVYLISYIFAGGPAPCDPDGNEVPDC